jgi:hypothetical protein
VDLVGIHPKNIYCVCFELLILKIPTSVLRYCIFSENLLDGPTAIRSHDRLDGFSALKHKTKSASKPINSFV